MQSVNAEKKLFKVVPYLFWVQVKQLKSVIWLFLKINLSITMLIESSRGSSIWLVFFYLFTQDPRESKTRLRVVTMPYTTAMNDGDRHNNALNRRQTNKQKQTKQNTLPTRLNDIKNLRSLNKRLIIKHSGRKT